MSSDSDARANERSLRARVRLALRWLAVTVLAVLVGVIVESLLPKGSAEKSSAPEARAPAITTGAEASADQISLGGWGPRRPTFSTRKPPTFVTFNSITNNPSYGDERNFVLAKPAESRHEGGFQDDQLVVDGGEYVVRVFISNDATRKGSWPVGQGCMERCRRRSPVSTAWRRP